MKKNARANIEQIENLDIPKRLIWSFKRLDNVIVSENKDDYISREYPLEISIKQKESSLPPKNISVTMRTKGMDKELATGFLFTEGIIRNPSEIVNITISENKVIVTLSRDSQDQLDKIKRHFYTSSSCGICSKSSSESIYTNTSYLPYSSTLHVSAEKLFGLKSYFEQQGSIFHKTGGIHSCVLLDSSMNKVGFFEDVGRHNALDKLIGWAIAQDSLPLDDHIILLSGRISFELVQKASMTGVSILCALGAPSTMAIDEAFAQSMCLVGFAKDDSYNVYCGNERIIA